MQMSLESNYANATSCFILNKANSAGLRRRCGAFIFAKARGLATALPKHAYVTPFMRNRIGLAQNYRVGRGQLESNLLFLEGLGQTGKQRAGHTVVNHKLNLDSENSSGCICDNNLVFQLLLETSLFVQRIWMPVNVCCVI